MKKIHFPLMLMMILMVISCSKGEEEMLRNRITSIELDLSSIEYPYNVIEENGKTKCYIIDIPCKETSINLKLKDVNIVFLYEIKTGIYDNISNEYMWYNSVMPYTMPGFKNENNYYWTFNSDFGNYDMTDEYVLKCQITENNNNSIRTTMLVLDYVAQQSCSVIFRQTPNL